ncbi:MAG TPA: hypothetical protein VD788_00725 [Candidatus Polarisedimenticolaceae bacterium]|nr:hypothetical protein [Candidatus Polarisedimenticolaceae bacterium]
MRRRIRLPAIALFLATGAGAAAAERYEIRFNRPMAVGDRFLISATGSLTNTTTMIRDEAVVRHDDLSIRIELQALIEILEVDERGRPLRESLGVDFLVYGAGDAPTQALPTGSVIIAETVGSRTDFRLEHGELPAMARAALQIVVGTYTGDVPDDDLIFGTTEPQPVGGSWGVDAAAFARAMRANGVVLGSDGLDGTVELVGVERIEGVECLRVEAVVKVDGLATRDVAQGIEQLHGSAEVELTGLFPTDLGRPRMHDSKTVGMELVVKSTAGPMTGTTMRSTSLRQGKKTMIPFARRQVSDETAPASAGSD